jgi:tRNA nucleotidyltransferase/poly(A) polymerase
MNVSIPKNAKKILTELRNRGFDAYLVGGTARDLLIDQNFENLSDKLELKDYDVTTNATPKEIKEVFKNYRQLYIGERHGTITIRYKGINYDVTTYRIDGKYTDGRRPDSVTFVTELEQDLSRRDFTINAITLDIDGVVDDPFNGLMDLQLGIIKTVGDPFSRFTEDSLRLLRAIRFAVRFNFRIDEATFEAMKRCANLISVHEISSERIYMELSKIFTYNYKEGITLLIETKVFQYVFPDIYEILIDESNLFNFSYLKNMSSLPRSHEGIPWMIIFHMLSIKNLPKSQLELLISNYKGMSKAVRQYILNSILGYDMTLKIFQSKISKGDVYRWIIDLRRPYKNNYNEFRTILPKDMHRVVSKSILLNNLVPEKELGRQFRYLDVHIDEFMKLYDNKKPPVGGNEAKSIGCKGIAIKWMLEIWELIFYREINRSQEDYLKLGNQLSQKTYLSFETLLNKISFNDPSGGINEINAINKEIKTLKNLIEFFKGECIVIISNFHWNYYLKDYWNSYNLVSRTSDSEKERNQDLVEVNFQTNNQLNKNKAVMHFRERLLDKKRLALEI